MGRPLREENGPEIYSGADPCVHPFRAKSIQKFVGRTPLMRPVGTYVIKNGFLVSVGADPCVRPLTFSIYEVDLSHVPTIVSAGPKANTSRKQLFIYLDPHIQHISLKPLLPHP